MTITGHTTYLLRHHAGYLSIITSLLDNHDQSCVYVYVNMQESLYLTLFCATLCYRAVLSILPLTPAQSFQ